MSVKKFRNNIPNLLKKQHTNEEIISNEEIIITNRDKPLGVLVGFFTKYQPFQEIMEYAEDMKL